MDNQFQAYKRAAERVYGEVFIQPMSKIESFLFEQYKKNLLESYMSAGAFDCLHFLEELGRFFGTDFIEKCKGSPEAEQDLWMKEEAAKRGWHEPLSDISTVKLLQHLDAGMISKEYFSAQMAKINGY